MVKRLVYLLCVMILCLASVKCEDNQYDFQFLEGLDVYSILAQSEAPNTNLQVLPRVVTLYTTKDDAAPDLTNEQISDWAYGIELQYLA